MNRLTSVVALVMVLCVSAGCGGRTGPGAESPRLPAAAAVHREPLLPTDGSKLAPMPQGDVKVLLFLRTDCPIANRYAPEIRRLCTTYAEGVVWWLVYPNPKLSAAKIDDHMVQFDLPCKAFHDVEHQLVRQTGVTITPEAAVYGKDNQLLYCGRIDNWYAEFGRARPRATQHDLEIAIQAAMSGNSVSPVRRQAVGCYISDLLVDDGTETSD